MRADAGVAEGRRARRAKGLRLALAIAALTPLGLAGAARSASGDAPPPPAPSQPAPRSTTLLLQPPPSMSSVTLGKTLPDPAPLVSKDQWVYDLRYSGGDLYLLGIHRVELGAAQATPRAMGRFALELFEGATLLERVRFDFPMLGDGVPPSPPDAGGPLPIQGKAPSLTAKISSRIGVMFPAITKGTRVDIVDRATSRRWPLPWPPTELSVPAVTAEAGADGG